MKTGPLASLSLTAICSALLVLCGGCYAGLQPPTWTWCTEIKNAHHDWRFEGGSDTSPIALIVTVLGKDDAEDSDQDAKTYDLDLLDQIPTQADDNSIYRTCHSSTDEQQGKYTTGIHAYAAELAQAHADGQLLKVESAQTEVIGDTVGSTTRPATLTITEDKDGSLTFRFFSDRTLSPGA